MTIDALFAGIAVEDLDAGQRWYARLLGRPADVVVSPDEVMWQITEAGWLYLVRDQRRAGHALVTLAVTDLEATLAAIDSREIAPATFDTIPDAGRKASVMDPDGNIISVIEISSADD